MITNKINLLGRRFGRWKVVSCKPHPRRRGSLWLCQCECGNQGEVRSDQLTSGRSKSCGCLKSELLIQRFTKHGASRSLTYRTWISMVYRCTDPGNANYPLYGGRGIKVCDRWLDFLTFLEDVGPRPSKDHTIDRIDNNGNYELGNVRWATNIVQGNNRRTNRVITVAGITGSATVVARKHHQRPDIVLARLHNGWNPEETINRPVAPRTRRRDLARALAQAAESKEAA